LQLLWSPYVTLSVGVQDSEPMLLGYRGFAFGGFKFGKDKAFNFVG
jgi:hypothetical protein